jgi:hypothetical protein
LPVSFSSFTAMSTTSVTVVKDALKVQTQNERHYAPKDVPEEIDLIEKIHVIPSFDDPYAERQWAKEQMAGAFRVWAKLGYNDGAGGHISLRDPVQPDCFWISKLGQHIQKSMITLTSA